MSSSGAASDSLADRLVAACFYGDLPSVKAAIADGASVEKWGRSPRRGAYVLPLAAAVDQRRHDVVVWLLSHGADPNGDRVMQCGAGDTTAAVLQLLVDAGGSVNREGLNDVWGPPLFHAVHWN